MLISNNFETIRLSENGILLSDKSSKQKEILFSDLDKIYITANKISQTQEALSILALMFLTFISLLFLQAEIIIPIFIFITFITILKLNEYKSYRLKVRLKDGSYFRKHIPSKLKGETVAMLNDIVKQFYYFKINT